MYAVGVATLLVFYCLYTRNVTSAAKVVYIMCAAIKLLTYTLWVRCNM